MSERRRLIAAIDEGAGAGGGSFWAVALAAHGGVASRIGLRDAVLLGALADVSVEAAGGGSGGFRLVFEFREGDAFFAGKVVKEFVADEAGGATRGAVAGDGIPWKEGVANRGGPFFEWLEGGDDVYGVGSAIGKQVVPNVVDLFFGPTRENEPMGHEDGDEEHIGGIEGEGAERVVIP